MQKSIHNHINKQKKIIAEIKASNEDNCCIDITQAKQLLIQGLKAQQELMNSNANLMKAINGDDSINHTELTGAADITGNWCTEIEKEIQAGSK